MAKAIRNWVIVFVVMIVLTLVWHQGIFGAQYPAHLDKIVTKDAAGNPAPRMLYFMLAHVVAAIGFVFYIPAVARSRMEYAWHGAVMGLVTFGMFALLSHALFQNWTRWLMAMDICFGLLAGAITGVILSYLTPAAGSIAPPARVG